MCVCMCMCICVRESICNEFQFKRQQAYVVIASVASNQTLPRSVKPEAHFHCCQESESQGKEHTHGCVMLKDAQGGQET